MILRICKAMKFLVSIIMWAARRPLTVVACEVLMKAAAESGTGSFSNIVRLYKSLIILKAEIFLGMGLGVRSTTYIGTSNWHGCMMRIGRRCRRGGIRHVLGGSLPLQFFVFGLELPQIAN